MVEGILATCQTAELAEISCLYSDFQVFLSLRILKRSILDSPDDNRTLS